MHMQSLIKQEQQAEQKQEQGGSGHTLLSTKERDRTEEHSDGRKSISSEALTNLVVQDATACRKCPKLVLRGNCGLRDGLAPFDESCNDLIDNVWMRNGAHVAEPFKFYELDIRTSGSACADQSGQLTQTLQRYLHYWTCIVVRCRDVPVKVKALFTDRAYEQPLFITIEQPPW